MNIQERANKLGIVVYDLALPLAWYDEVHLRINKWPQEYGFVWSYDVNTIWGEPIPVTKEALDILREYHVSLVQDKRYHSALGGNEPAQCRTCSVIELYEDKLNEIE